MRILMDVMEIKKYADNVIESCGLVEEALGTHSFSLDGTLGLRMYSIISKSCVFAGTPEEFVGKLTAAVFTESPILQRMAVKWVREHMEDRFYTQIAQDLSVQAVRVAEGKNL